MSQPQTGFLRLDVMGILFKILKYWPNQTAHALIEVISMGVLSYRR